MAIFKKIEPDLRFMDNCIYYKVEGKITEHDVIKINQLSSKTILILENTKDQNAEILKSINSSNVSFSVLGGINYLNKNKYKMEKYFDRTIIKPHVLSLIIEYFEKIERQIRYSWTDTQKCMFVYKKLVEELHYKTDFESDYEQGKDVVRSLDGVLYGKMVCAGFALVFKEMMDRLNIGCEYQNKPHTHSWNVVNLEGKNYAIDLTWDCCNKGPDNKCYFYHFGLDKDFYNNRNHDISNETDETEYEIDLFDLKTIARNYIEITNKGNIRKEQMNLKRDNNDYFYYLLMGKHNNISNYMVYLGSNLYYISTDCDEDVLTTDNIISAIKYNNGCIFKKKQNISKNNLKSYVREDGSNFLIGSPRELGLGMNEHSYFDVISIDNTLHLRRGILLSENNLHQQYDNNKDWVIANRLLSQERLARKIKHYNGYVGYVGYDNYLYYSEEFEEQLNIKNRL